MRKNLHRNTPKLNIPICIAAVLFCMTLFSTYFVSGLYARYTSSGQGGGSARVAKFSVKGSGVLSQPIVAELVPGKTDNTNLIVIENKSEVTVEYTITVTNVTKNLPLEFSVTKAGTEPAEDKWAPEKCDLTTQQIAGSHTDNFALHIKWDDHPDEPDISEEYLEMIGQVDYITVTVTATQVD